MRSDRLARSALALLWFSACGADDAVDTTVGDVAADAAPGRDASPVNFGDANGGPTRAVVVNEVILGDEPGDRVELLNSGPVDVDLGGAFVTDDPASAPRKAQLPAGTIVPAGGFLVLTLTDATVGFGLGADEAFGLFASDGAPIDQTDWATDAAPEGGAWGRLPDGTGAFRTLAIATPGAPNQTEPSADAASTEADSSRPTTDDAGVTADASATADLGARPPTTPVVLNEVVADGPDGDWVELHNPGDSPEALGGFSLTDDPIGDPFAHVLPVETNIEAGGYLVVFVSGATTGFGLGSDESIALVGADGAVVDQADWAEGEAPAGASFGRLPDATGPFSTCATPTPGAPNTDASPPACPFDCAPETGLVLNEIVAAGEPTDAVELYNGNNTDADLEGYFVSDDPEGAPDRTVLPAGARVPARGYLVLEISEDTVGFRLAAAEAFSLIAPDGRVVDETSWAEGDSPAEGAWARRPNGVGAFHATEVATLGAPNLP